MPFSLPFSLPIPHALFGAITWDLDPILLRLGPLQIRYYGVCFAATIYTAFLLWRSRAIRAGHSPMLAEKFLWYGVVAVILGSRLGHCFFYEPAHYLAHPIQILYFWKGGLASHGATVGVIAAVWLFARNNKLTFSQVGDYLMPSVAIASGGVRIGNFFNSEVVGRAWDGPWAVIFTRYDHMMGINPPIPRHPSQFYEVLMGLAAYGAIWLVERKKIRHMGSGLTIGVLLSTYFSFRFVVEFFKEYQVDGIADNARQIAAAQDGLQLTMGQYLSLPVVAFGIFMIVRALRQPKDAIPEPQPWDEAAWLAGEQARVSATTAKSKGKRGKKRK